MSYVNDHPTPPHPGGRPDPNFVGGPGLLRPVSSEDRSMALIAHLSTLAGMLVSAGWLSFVGPLVVWLMFKDKSWFVRESSAGAFNFNVTMWLVNLVGWIFCFTVVGIVVGLPLIAFSWIMQLVCHIVGAVRANRGELFRYPLQIRILS